MSEDLKSLREASGLTTRNVATILGITQPAVTILESGRHAPRTDTLARYYAAVGRMDLAQELEPLLSADRWDRVRRVARTHDELAPGMRCWKNGVFTPPAVPAQ